MGNVHSGNLFAESSDGAARGDCFGKLGCSQFSPAKKLGYDVVGLRPNDGLTEDSIF